MSFVEGIFDKEKEQSGMRWARIFHIEAGIQGTVHTSGILHAR